MGWEESLVKWLREFLKYALDIDMEHDFNTMSYTFSQRTELECPLCSGKGVIREEHQDTDGNKLDILAYRQCIVDSCIEGKVSVYTVRRLGYEAFSKLLGRLLIRR